MSTQSHDYPGHRFPPEMISYAVWLSYRFWLSFRDAEERLAQRGETLSYEAVRQWSVKFGPPFAKQLRYRHGRLGDTWHLDEICVSIQGQRPSLWRAVEQDGDVRDMLVQPHQDHRAAARYFRKRLTGLHYVPRLLVTDRLGSYGAARRKLLPSVGHCHARRRNTRAEVSHQPTHQRAYQMRRFTAPGQAQRLLAVQGPIHNLFRLGRHLLSARHYRILRTQAFATWHEGTGLQEAAET